MHVNGQALISTARSYCCWRFLTLQLFVVCVASLYLVDMQAATSDAATEVQAMALQAAALPTQVPPDLEQMHMCQPTAA